MLKTTGLRAMHVAAGHAFSLVMLEDGTVLVAGDAGLSDAFNLTLPAQSAAGGAPNPNVVSFGVCPPQMYAAAWSAGQTATDRLLRPGRRHRLCAGLRHSLVYAPTAAAEDDEPQLSDDGVAVSAFGLARHGQLGIPLDKLPRSGGLVQAPEPVSILRRPPAFRPPIQKGSPLENRYYGELRPDRLAQLPQEERLRILISLGEAHAWRLPPSHPMYRPVQ